MIRIDWKQVQSLHTNLLQKGYNPETIVIIITKYKNGKLEKIKIELDNIFLTLSEIENDPMCCAVSVQNEYSGTTLFFAKSEKLDGNSLEIAPVGGHKQVVKDFALNSQKQKNAWVEMTIASIQDYLLNEKNK